MPYFITDKSPDCSGWATIKEDGEVIGCHATKQESIDQMVAVSIAEDMAPGGERIMSGIVAVICDIDGTLLNGSTPILKTIDYLDDLEGELLIVTGRMESDRTETEKALKAADVSYSRLIMNDDSSVNTATYKGATAKELLKRYNITLAIDNDDKARAAYRAAGITVLNPADIQPIKVEDAIPIRVLPDEDEDRQVSLEVPIYIRTAARKGLDYYGQGLAGQGLVDRTVREARDMAQGQISKDKVVRANAWAQRHAVDLDAPKNSDAGNDEFPGAGAVAHYLWGINPLNPQPAKDWFTRKSDAIKAERGLFTFQRKKDDYFANIPTMEDMPVETRRVVINEFEFRQGPTGDGMSFTGYAAVFNSDSEPLPFIERIAPGAFKKSLKSRNTIKMYMNHDSSMLLASTRSKTLRLEEDSKGLLVNADLPNTTVGRDLSVLMKRGDVESMSFGFSVPAGGDTWSNDGMSRELRAVRLHEVSVVTGFPAYTATSASVRSLDILAERTGVDADKLAEAITVLEAGGTLSDESADLLSGAVSKLRAEPTKVPSSINLMAKHLDLLKSF